MSDPRPPKSPRKGKYVNIRIAFLNDTVHVFQVPVKGVGLLLWEAVVNHLQLLEADYFDLEYTNHNGDDCWLDKDKAVLKQIGSPDIPLRFCVKFYTPDPGLLEDELTRYLFALQIRKDLLRGELKCSENTAALLASYIVQGEIGDFDVDEYQDPTYLAVFKFVPEHLQTHEFMAKVMDYHKQHVGESPSEADLNLLDTARKVELYGIKMQSAKDHESASLNLAVAHLGVLVFQHFTKINTFSWAKVRKLSFKRKKFLIKLHADTYDRRLEGVTQTPTKPGRGYYKDTVEFFFDTRDRCKLFWKRCIEHHAFFRCQVVAKVARNKTRVVSRGSSFRYCGRTQKQLVEFVRENIGKRPQFERATSGRISSRSTSVTPKFSSKPSMHSSSADLHTSSGSRSSGSHILDSNHTPGSGVSRDHSGTPHSAMRVESVDVHSDSSMSGSRSLNSPRLEHGLSLDQDVIEAVNARTGGAMTDDEEEEDNDKDDTYSRGREGILHVASDTKGAHSLLSPEINSPVRYVGIYSEVGSPYCHRVDGSVTPDVDIAIPDGSDTARVVSPPDFDKQDVVEKLSPLGGGCQHPAVVAGHIGNESQTDTSNVSVCSGGVLPDSDLSNQAPRPNLHLMFTDITPSSQPASSVTTLVDRDHPKSNTSPTSLSHQCRPKSSPLPDACPSPATKPVCTTAPHVSATTSSQTTAVSASQNANDLVRENTLVLVKSDPDGDVSSSHKIAKPPPHFHHDTNNRHESMKVSLTDPALHQRQAKVKDRSPSFPITSPTSSQHKDNDVRSSLDVSPSSCVTDIAESRQDQKVRLSSRVSSADSKNSSVSDARERPFSAPSEPVVEGRDSGLGQTPGLKAKAECEGTVLDNHTPELKAEDGAERVGSERGGAVDKSQSKDPQRDKADLKKLYPNGGVVGAGLPVKDQLEASQGMSRKLSAGTDLIEDIPYILHRRLDGQKEETALYKVSEADKMSRQRSASPGVKGVASVCVQEKPKPATDHQDVETVSTIPDNRCITPEVASDSKNVALPSSGSGRSSATGVKGRPLLEKSPPLNRRFEFVNVHKLPSRTSYSSVDDTTSPSGEQEILKQLEQGAVSKSAASKGGETSAHVCPASTALTDIQNESELVPEASADNESAVCAGTSKVVAETAEHEVTQLPLSENDEVPCSDPRQPELPHTTELNATSVVTDVSGELLAESVVHETLDVNGVKLPNPEEQSTEISEKDLNIGASDECPKAEPAATQVPVSAATTALSGGVSNVISDVPEAADTSSHQQFFEISKPQPCHGYDTSDGVFIPAAEGDKGVPKSLSLRSIPAKPSDLSMNTFGKPGSTTISSSGEEKDYQPNDTRVKVSSSPAITMDGQPPQQRAPFLSNLGRTSTSSTSSSSETNQFLIDLPSPAAALFYSDNDSPPTSQTGGEPVKSALTFSTFRPDPAEEALKADESSKIKSCIRSLHNLEEDEESTDFEVIMAEGVVEKSALKKRTNDEADKPKEPKRVSWHEDSDVQHSYHSDLSMTAQRSPVDECDTHSIGEATTPLDSGNILETLENLQCQNSESDMTNSGSSDSSSEDSDIEAKNNHKQVYFRYAASKGFSRSTIDSGFGGLSEGSRSQGHESSPLESLERLESMEGSGSSFGGGRLKLQEDLFKLQQDNSPLEPLEKLCGLRVDNFDDEGEADDEDDEPNFPPPPPMLDIPEEMLMSYESDLPLPDMSLLSSGSLTFLDRSAASSSAIPSAAAYPSDSDSEMKASVRGATCERIRPDPLASLDFGDLVGDRNCTTSESESDFDAEDANVHLRRMSAGSFTPRDKANLAAIDFQRRSFSEVKKKSSSGRPSVPEMKKIQEKPQVLPKPTLHRQSAQGTQEGAQASHSTHVVQKSQPLPVRSAPPPIYPKPQPPPVHPRPGPIRQPQMGKGKHFERTRHKSSSSSSSSSSSEPWQHQQPHHS